jgi:hypothetical protein
MGSIYTPDSESELALLQSLLEGQNIKAYVSNDYLGPITSTQNIFSTRPKTIMVPDNQEERAKEIIRAYLGKVSPEKLNPMNQQDAKKADKTMFFILVSFIVGWVFWMVINGSR